MDKVLWSTCDIRKLILMAQPMFDICAANVTFLNDSERGVKRRSIIII